MEELNTPIFAQAKVEYTSQLIDVLYSHMFDGIKSIYDESKIIYRSKRNTPILFIFRELLEKVPIWNSEIIESECNRIINNSNCDWIDDLITAVFISHTKILTSIGPNRSFQKINIIIPKCSTFIHKCYINAARELWKNPYLFNESVPGHEFQKNNKEIEEIIKKCIENTIRNSLPIKDILKEHLEGETDSILNQKEELKKMLREELSNLNTAVSTDNSTRDNNNIDNSTRDNIDDSCDSIEEEEEDIQKEDDEPNIQKEDDEPNIQKEEDEPNIQKEEDKPTIQKEDDEPNIQKEEDIEELKNKMETIIQNEKDTLNEIELLDKQADYSGEKFPSSNDPSDDTIEKECSNIVVNDITIPVDVPGDDNKTLNQIKPEEEIKSEEEIKPVVEIKYDNVDISDNKDKDKTPDENRLKKLMTNMWEPEEEVNVIKSNDISNPIIESTSVNPIPIESTPNNVTPVNPISSISQVSSDEEKSSKKFTLNNLYPGMINSNKPSIEPLEIKEIKEDKSTNDPTTDIPPRT